jgi:hypothetical protein
MVLYMVRNLALALAMASVMTAGTLSGGQKPAEKPRIIKLERFRKALWTVDVTVDGKPGEFLLDSGGGNTLLTAEYAAKLNCKFWGRTTGYNMFGKRADGPHCDNVQIKAGDAALSSVSVGTIDFGDRFAGDKTPDGLLSLDAFDGKAITLDQVAGMITIETSSSLAARTKRMQELPFRVSRECSARCLSVFVGVPTSQGMTWLILDSGAGGVSLIAKDYAGIFGLDPARKEQRLIFDIAPGVPVDSPVVVTDMIMDGNLGQPFMSRYIITLDLARSRLWLAKAL